MLFNIQMMRLPLKPWFAIHETIAELQILPGRHVIMLPNEVLTNVFKDTSATAKKNAVIVKIAKVNHKGRCKGDPVKTILEVIKEILDENRSPTANITGTSTAIGTQQDGSNTTDPLNPKDKSLVK